MIHFGWFSGVLQLLGLCGTWRNSENLRHVHEAVRFMLADAEMGRAIIQQGNLHTAPPPHSSLPRLRYSIGSMSVSPMCKFPSPFDRYF